MRNTTRRLLGAAALLALSTTGLLGGTASATPDKAPPVPGDDRAVSGAKNLEWDHPNACATAGLTGTAIDGDPEEAGAVTLANTVEDKKLLTITGGLEGFTVTGVVVKGGPAYNVYTAAKLGELAWEDLHAPHNSSGGPADISHWFFCVEKVTTPDNPGEENPGGENPGEENPGGENPGEENPGEENPGENPGGENPGEETEEVTPTTTESVAVTPTSTTTPAVADGGDNGDLADTGFDGGWMLVVGLGLVAAGAAFVASPKLRGLLRR